MCVNEFTDVNPLVAPPQDRYRRESVRRIFTRIFRAKPIHSDRITRVAAGSGTRAIEVPPSGGDSVPPSGGNSVGCMWSETRWELIETIPCRVRKPPIWQSDGQSDRWSGTRRDLPTGLSAERTGQLGIELSNGSMRESNLHGQYRWLPSGSNLFIHRLPTWDKPAEFDPLRLTKPHRGDVGSTDPGVPIRPCEVLRVGRPLVKQHLPTDRATEPTEASEAAVLTEDFGPKKNCGGLVHDRNFALQTTAATADLAPSKLTTRTARE